MLIIVDIFSMIRQLHSTAFLKRNEKQSTFIDWIKTELWEERPKMVRGNSGGNDEQINKDLAQTV